MKKNKIVIILLIFLPLLVGLLSAYLTKDNMILFDQLNKPPLSPPAWLFPVAWSILYLLMGISSVLVYTNKNRSSINKLGLFLHGLQLVFNFFWSIIFFNMKAYLLAFVWLMILWLSVIFMIITYRKISKTAFVLSIPYICWLTFAAYLNALLH